MVIDVNYYCRWASVSFAGSGVSSLCRNQGDRAYILTEPCVGYRMAKGEEQEQKTALSD